MDVLEQLLDLHDGVPLGEGHVDVELQARGGLPGVLRLELLELLVGVQEGDHDLRHHRAPWARRFSFSFIQAVPATK